MEQLVGGVHSFDALVDRLTDGAYHDGKPIVFLMGSALSAPHEKDGPGVPLATGIVDSIRNRFSGENLEILDRELEQASNRYQTAFNFLLGRRGPDIANSIIKEAVGNARKVDASSSEQYRISSKTKDEVCAAFEKDTLNWHLSPGLTAFGNLVTTYDDYFDPIVLTTNFDPLISASIRAAGGQSFRTVLHRDGDLTSSSGDGSHIVHLHGYWYGNDTLHTPRQLMQNRPRLKASLSQLLANKLVVVVGYGGWDDIFLEALFETVIDDHAKPEIAWTTFGKASNLDTKFIDKVSPGIDRGRVAIYENVDCNELFPELQKKWQALTNLNPSESRLSLIDRPKRDLETVDTHDEVEVKLDFSLIDDARPPSVQHFVGREQQLSDLSSPDTNFTFITGIAGQGKSALASQFCVHPTQIEKYDYVIWRDCREQSERFERQLAGLVCILSKGSTSFVEISSLPIDELTSLFCEYSDGIKLLLIFDNVDHYVDLENSTLSGTPAEFLKSFENKKTESRFIFTCRPKIEYANKNVNTIRLEGISPAETKALFERWKVKFSTDELERVFKLTNGHVFWIDLLAAQVANRVPAVTFDELVADVKVSKSTIPESTLESIWLSLRDREKTVLQALAEAVRPISAIELAEVISSMENFKNTNKALKTLRSLNLLVAKNKEEKDILFELHPLIKRYIKGKFSIQERKHFVDSFLEICSSIISIFTGDIVSLSVDKHEKWLERAELYLEIENHEAAFNNLIDVRIAYERSDDPSEFVRICNRIFEVMDWEKFEDYPEFDYVFNSYFDILTYLGRTEKCSELLEKYKETVPVQDARYINYCDRKAQFYWQSRNFDLAIKWSSKGVKLKSDSDVDTTFDCAHTLALAQRDGGIIDPALSYFLENRNLSELIDPKSLNEEIRSHTYGNVGRCLQFMGQIEPALICYRKCGIKMSISTERTQSTNEAFLRQWVGELLQGSEADSSSAAAFLLASYSRWKTISPPKAQHIANLLKQFDIDAPFTSKRERGLADREFVSWIAAARDELA